MTGACDSGSAEDRRDPTGPAHSQDRRCPSCDATPSTNHADSTEDCAGSSQSVSRSSGGRACGDVATEFNDPEGGKKF